MLDELLVKNLGIIDSAHLEPGPGFVVVTGETGAGKTMLLGALRLLMGASSKREGVGPFADESTVDGRFIFGDDEVTLRRRTSAGGRSRAYIDGSMVPAKALQERTSGRVEVVGQHDHMLLTTASGARLLVDGALGEKGRASLDAYGEAWQELVMVRQKLELLGGGRRELERELEMVRFQAEEIAAAGFAEGEDSELKGRADRLRNAEDLAAGFDTVLSALGDDGAMGGLSLAAGELNRLARLDAELSSAADRLGAAIESIAELHLDLASAGSDLKHEPGELDAIEGRIQELNRLRRKYGESLAEVLSFGEQAASRVQELETLLGTADELAVDLASAEAVARNAAATLTSHRELSASALADAATGHLRELGMTSPVVSFGRSAVELGPAGADRIELRFASDPSLVPGPASKVASGGELSRLTLALRLAAGIGDAELLAFDEVDAGIGGATALAMGEKLAALAKGRQLFCVTHLPQVAAFADTHFVVERSGAAAEVRAVDGDERLAELSRMLGGLADSERGQMHAAELLATARGE